MAADQLRAATAMVVAEQAASGDEVIFFVSQAR
jgi:hypothetical protein